MRMQAPSGSLEWLCSNRLGSFALGCADRRLRRKYHSLLTVREPGQGGPWNVLAEVHEVVRELDLVGTRPASTVDAPLREQLLCDSLYGALQPAELASFSLAPSAAGPLPVHAYRTQSGIEIQRTVSLSPEHDQVELSYRVRGVRAPLQLGLSPILRCRPLHELTRANPFLDGSLNREGNEVRMLPYWGMPGLAFAVHGAPFTVAEGGNWYSDVHYPWESERGYEASEDVFGPGTFWLSLERDAELVLAVAVGRTVAPSFVSAGTGPAPRKSKTSARTSSRPPAPAPSQHVSAPELQGSALEQAVARFAASTRDGRSTVIAGFPWYGPRGRDTLLALPGLHLGWNDFERTAGVLDGLLASRVGGLIPNAPAVAGEPASGASVDASLLFARVVQWLGQREGQDRVARFMPAVCELLEALADASEPRMRFDDGVGVWTERGPWALTWMDSIVDGWPVTPRAGYAVDLDALAYNAARFAVEWAEINDAGFARAFRHRLQGAEARFTARYWDEKRGYLADCHDGRSADGSLRPNQLWALGLPHRPVPAAVARTSLEAVTRGLLTPAGLRTLAPGNPSYRGSYAGTPGERDRAAHQGTVWPWLLGIYADAVFATLGHEALEPALAPVLSFMRRHLEQDGCAGQVSEVFGGDAPHHAGGAPAHAASVAELLRVERLLAAVASDAPKPTAKPRAPKKATPPKEGHGRETTAK
jgi:predicted glycogen debranching enzyme